MSMRARNCPLKREPFTPLSLAYSYGCLVLVALWVAPVGKKRPYGWEWALTGDFSEGLIALRRVGLSNCLAEILTIIEVENTRLPGNITDQNSEGSGNCFIVVNLRKHVHQFWIAVNFKGSLPNLQSSCVG